MNPGARGFAAASSALATVFVASGTPIPLFDHYRHAAGLSTSDLSATAVVYFLSVMVALVIGARLSDHLGRRNVTIGGLLIAMAGCALLYDVTGLTQLIIGRGLLGAACGVVSVSASAYVTDLAPRQPRWAGPIVVSTAPPFGMAVGTIACGVLAQYSPMPAQSPFLLALGLLALSIAACMSSPDGAAPQRSGAFRSLLPKVAWPATNRHQMPAMVAIVIAPWAVGGFYQTFIPTILASDLGTSDKLIGAAVLCSFLVSHALGGPLSARLHPLTAQRLGATGFALAVLGTVIGMSAGSVVFFMTAGFISGLFQGMSLAGVLRAMLPLAAPAERAGLMATVYLFSYLGAAVPTMISGALSTHTTLDRLAPAYVVLSSIAAAVVITSTRRR